LKRFEADFRDSRRVLAKRCTKCNRISFYAQDFVDMPSINEKYKSMSWIFIGFAVGIIIIGLIASLNGY